MQSSCRGLLNHDMHAPTAAGATPTSSHSRSTLPRDGRTTGDAQWIGTAGYRTSGTALSVDCIDRWHISAIITAWLNNEFILPVHGLTYSGSSI